MLPLSTGPVFSYIPCHVGRCGADDGIEQCQPALLRHRFGTTGGIEAPNGVSTEQNPSGVPLGLPRNMLENSVQAHFGDPRHASGTVFYVVSRNQQRVSQDHGILHGALGF